MMYMAISSPLYDEQLYVPSLHKAISGYLFGRTVPPVVVLSFSNERHSCEQLGLEKCKLRWFVR